MHKEDYITLKDLKKGSDDILRLVYEDNRPKFLNFAKRYNLPEEDLVDIYQEAYIAFYDNVMNGRIKEFTSTISTYITSIGKYMIFDKLKYNKRIVHPDFDISVLNNKDDLIDTLDIDNENLTTEQQLLYKHFSTLGKKCKELLDLFYYRGFTIKDILMHTEYNSENVIKSTKSRCMKILKERILNTN
ncbi:sigma-70 family RNA polymerase sigma factor [uncultured Winogradskyella sp.]|uniref:sigma-70 family RNA polymerase sigma factor n=1 Tax=uncultured Winogradskyella sp. TaxID=395353 RepID=UPI002611BBA5|nr:sigma-70 family RNA polymerase sigma factor [uncultured Winogradskyella sp.]